MGPHAVGLAPIDRPGPSVRPAINTIETMKLPTALRLPSRAIREGAAQLSAAAAVSRADEQESRWAGAFHGALIGMALVDLDGTWRAVNPALCRLLGRDEATLLATDFQSLTHPADLDSDLAQVKRVLAGEIDGYEIEKRFIRPDGEVIWALLSVALIAVDGEPLYFVSQLQDITARKTSDAELQRYAEELSRLARTDPVTGLHNHRDFHALIDAELARARRSGEEWSLVLLDIDGFADLAARDRSGGDEVLHHVGTAIGAACRASDIAARIGSDEFALILPGTSNEAALLAAGRIAGEVARRGLVSLSFGAVTWPYDGDTRELLLLRADMQRAAAKADAGAFAPVAASALGSRALAPVREIVSIARRHLDMDIAYVAEIAGSEQVFSVIDGDASSFGISEGDSLELAGTFCERMLSGQIPHLVPDVADEAELAALPVARTADIKSYLGVPVTLSNGHVYGTLCGVSHKPAQALGEDHIAVMTSLSRLLTIHLERGVESEAEGREQAERTGIHALLSALLARDHYTGEHSRFVVELATRVARELGLDDSAVRDVEQVALLHDIGKVGIPDAVLQKRDGLSEAEWVLMRQHPVIGARILASTRSLAHLAAAVGAEHERFDGEGYPDGLRGDEIPLASRITFACDAYHAMTSDRPYRRALGATAAQAELQAGAGAQFDPRVVAALVRVLQGERRSRAADDESASVRCDDVLSARPPRQTPVWTPAVAPTAPAVVGETRAVCRRCGVHVNAIVTRAALGGSCHNCGSYELEIPDTVSPE